jgi:hypothetical protein
MYELVYAHTYVQMYVCVSKCSDVVGIRCLQTSLHANMTIAVSGGWVLRPLDDDSSVSGVSNDETNGFKVCMSQSLSSRLVVWERNLHSSMCVWRTILLVQGVGFNGASMTCYVLFVLYELCMLIVNNLVFGYGQS